MKAIRTRIDRLEAGVTVETFVPVYLLDHCVSVDVPDDVEDFTITGLSIHIAGQGEVVIERGEGESLAGLRLRASQGIGVRRPAGSLPDMANAIRA